MKPLDLDRAIQESADPDAEREVLATSMRQSGAFEALCADLGGDAFTRAEHRDMWKALQALHERGEPLKPESTRLEMMKAGMAQAKASDLVLELLDRETGWATTTSSAKPSAERVRELAARRQGLGLVAEQYRALANGSNLGDLTGLAERVKSIAAISGGADRRPHGKLGVRWIGDTFTEPPDEPPELVSGLMRAGELVVVGASRGIGKSWLAMNLALLLARGEGLFLGALEVRNKARVLIAEGEVGPWDMYRRWEMLTGEDVVPEGIAETFDRWRIRASRIRHEATVDGQEVQMERAIAQLDARVERAVTEHGFAVLVIDPWKVYFAGNENSNDETEAALDQLRSLALRRGCAIFILHHLSKALEVREPEDAWRGASRLADWASTRVTLLPHYTEAQARKQGMTRQQARRYVDVKFLRRAEPTDDFSIVFDHTTGWWSRWRAPEDAAAERRIVLASVDVAEICRQGGGDWPSMRAAAAALKLSKDKATELLAAAVRDGALESYKAPRGATGYRLPIQSLDLDGDVL